MCIVQNPKVNMCINISFLFSIAPGNIKCHANIITLAVHEFQFDLPMGVHDIIAIFILLSEDGCTNSFKIHVHCFQTKL